MDFSRSCSEVYSIVATDQPLTQISIDDSLTFPIPVEPAVADGLLLSLDAAGEP